MTTQDTSSFFTTHQTRDVPRDQWGRYKLPGPDGPETSYTRATTLAATMAEQYGLSIWHQRQVVWGLSRRPDLLTMASTIAGPEDKKALGEIVKEAHIAAGTQSKANRGTAIHSACHAAERGAFEQVPEELRPHVAGYFAELKRQRLEVIPEFVERTVIVPEYQTAGTFDNLLRCPDGKIRVGDKKTGRMDYSDIEFAIQMSLYANASAMFNYDTGRYEPMPEVAKDYAILMVIDPETGHCEAQRINIAWGWVWARTAFEVMAIRKTKAVITPLIPEEVSAENRDAFGWTTVGAPVQDTHLRREHDGTFTVNGQPVGPPPEHMSSGLPPALEQERIMYGVPTGLGTVPGPDGMTEEQRYHAFWSQPFDDEPDATVNGVPLEQYGKPNTHPCASGQPCEFTGTDGLHRDGTVCLMGNARPGPVPPQPEPTPRQQAAEDIEVPGGPEAIDPDDLVARIDGLKGGKAAVQNVARRLMERVGEPDAIKLQQYKVKIARACVDLAHKHGVPVPGPKDGDPDFGIPSGPAPTDPASGTAAATKAKAEPGRAEAAAPDPALEEKRRTAVRSIMACASIGQLQKVHAHYSQTSIGWTEEMQNAARTRAAQLEQEGQESPLSPLEMIQGATSRETLTKAWEKATQGGTDQAAWTEEMQAAANAKQIELSQGSPS